MLSLDRQETQRLAIQRQLDAARTPAERNKRGQFATPPTLAVDIFAYARTLLPPGVRVRFLDPALGTGSFLSALFRTFPIEQISTVVVYRIDSDYAARTLEGQQATPIHLHLADVR